ncbi:hypothetical protein [Janthinobacterium psychrotolerans]|uniref:hypothetical protein n=1 Tax=Janthinobacterium psychrotolerans TaxID=1747903 RepID=UPI00123755DD|nr:hypothetical protein [Janthinobacterium psychrotolerans]
MASIKQTPSGAFQIRIKNKLLPKTLWATFDTFEQACVAAQLEAWQPYEPNGEKAWFLLAVFDGGQGPCAYFVQKVIYAPVAENSQNRRSQAI